MRYRFASLALISAVAGSIWFVSMRADSPRSGTNLVPIDASGAANSANSPKIAWQPNFEAAMQSAKTQNKPVMISFYTDWCGACKMMDKETYTDPVVVSETEKWVSVKVNAEQRTDIAGAYGVTGYPTIVWAKSSGEPLSILPGAVTADAFAQMMKEAHSKFAA